MIVVGILFILINLTAYILTFLSWEKDCKKIGKENLAVQLDEAIFNIFIYITLPCIVGILMGEFK